VEDGDVVLSFRFPCSLLPAALVLASSANSVAAPPTPLDPDTATARFLAENPIVQALRAKPRIAEAKLTSARIRPNPTVSYELESLPGQPGVEGSRQHAFKIGQTILLDQLLHLRCKSGRVTGKIIR